MCAKENPDKKSSPKQHLALADLRVARIATVPLFVLAHLKHQITVCAEQGAEVLIVTSDGPELASLQTINGVSCVPIDIPRPISLWRDLRALFRLFLFFRQNHIHIAHSTTPKAGLLTAIAAFLARVPIRIHTFTGQPWVTMSGMIRWISRTSDRLIGLLNTRCYADSPSQRQFLIENNIINADHLAVIGAGSIAGVDLQRFDPRRFSLEKRIATRAWLGIPEHAPVLLFIGRIAIDKGINELILAYKKLKNEGNDIHLVLAGPFDSDNGAKGKIFQEDIHAHPDIHAVGYTEIPEEYLAIADILCLPSYREGFGTVIIEAAAMGIPAIGTNIYGLSDAIVDGETGILVPPRNADDLANAMLTLLENVPLRKRMGQQAQKRAYDLFGAEVISMKIIAEYQSLITQHLHTTYAIQK